MQSLLDWECNIPIRQQNCQNWAFWHQVQFFQVKVKHNIISYINHIVLYYLLFILDYSDDDESDGEIHQNTSLKRPLETGSVSEQTGSDPSDPGIADSKSDADLDQPSNRKKSRHGNEKLIRLLQRLFPTQKKEVRT